MNHKNTLILTLVLMLAGAGLTLAQSSQEERASRDAGDEAPAFEERYGILLENNIFRRDRQPPRTETAATSRPYVPPPPPERDWVLVGIVFEEGTFRAYLENRRSAAIARVVPGDELATGVVSDVFIDALGFEHDGETLWIIVGQDLTGGTPTLSSGSSSSQSDEDDEDSEDRDRRDDDDNRDDSRDDNDGNRSDEGSNEGSSEGMSIEERMRLRRQQETGRGD